MPNFLLVTFICLLLSGCLGDIVLGGGENTATSTAVLSRKPTIDPYTHEEVKMWVPKEGMIPNATWPFQARGEESRCSSGYYRGKSDYKLFPSQIGVYKKLSNGGWVWAYYYYGEDTPGFDVTDWYETVFNIYVRPDGIIYGCAWQKYSRGWHRKFGTDDGINPRTHPPR